MPIAEERAPLHDRGVVLTHAMLRLAAGGKACSDIDASLVQIHSVNKAGTGPNYKGGFGYSPMLCFADATGEALAGMLRPGRRSGDSAQRSRVAEITDLVDLSNWPARRPVDRT